MYDGSIAFENLLNPVSLTIDKGWKSIALILTNSSSTLLCLTWPIGVLTKLVIWLCLVLWTLVPDEDAVKVVTEETSAVEAQLPEADANSVDYCLTCTNNAAGCFVWRCLLKSEVVPPWPDKILLQSLHFAIAPLSGGHLQKWLLFLPVSALLLVNFGVRGVKKRRGLRYHKFCNSIQQMWGKG